MSNEIVKASGRPATDVAKSPQQKKGIELRDYIMARKDKIADILPKHLSIERVIKIALVAATKNKPLLECSIESVYMSIRDAAELGLELGGSLGHAYLVPYKGTCTLQIGYKGYIYLARNSGEIQSIEAHTVHEKDKCVVRFGLNSALEHEPFLDGHPGEMRLAYAIARFKDGGYQFEVMTKNDIDRIKASSKTHRDDSPWQLHYGEMARKTVIRRLIKFLPLSPEKSAALHAAIERDDSAIDVEVDALPTRSEEVLAMIDASSGAEPEKKEEVKL